MSTKLNQGEMQALVNDMLENAVDSGYGPDYLDNVSDYDIACDMCAYGDEQLPDHCQPEDLVRYVHEWKLVQER